MTWQTDGQKLDAAEGWLRPHDWLRQSRYLLSTTPTQSAAQSLEVFMFSSFPDSSVSEPRGRSAAQRCSRQRRSRSTEPRVRYRRQCSAQSPEVFMFSSFPDSSVSEPRGRSAAQRCSRQRRSRSTEPRVRYRRQCSAPHCTSLLRSPSLSRVLQHNRINMMNTNHYTALTTQFTVLASFYI